MPQSGIDKRAIAKLMKDMQREFDKHPIRVPMKAQTPRIQRRPALGPGAFDSGDVGTTIYNGPVIQGSADAAQLAWGNQTVHQQAVNRTEQIAPGFEAIAQAVVSTLGQLPNIGLAEEDEQDAEAAASEILAEVTQPEPDRGKVRRSLSALKWFLMPVATGVSTGAGEGAQEWAKTAIEQLGAAF